MPVHRHIRLAAACGAVALTAGLAGCAATPEATSTASAATAAVDLAAAGCPATVVVQTDWNPESEHGHIYQLLGDDYVVDAEAKSVTGTLTIDDASTGVRLEVRAGGPAIGFAGPATQMYTDPEITIGYVTTDDQIASYDTTPVTAFFAPLDLSPTMVMWDPETYPDVAGIEDLGDALAEEGGVWRYFSGSAYMQYLIDEGYVDEAQTDSSYDGTPANFVAAGGADVQQGFASAEPYIYENEVDAWGKPVAYQTISETGWLPYTSAMSVRADEVEELSGCLEALTPVLQQGEVDFYADPARANEIILQLVDEYATGWTYSQGVADYSVETQLADGLVGNGPNETIGDFDEDRYAAFFEDAKAVFAKTGTTVPDDVQATDLYTNEFIDESIGLTP